MAEYEQIRCQSLGWIRQAAAIAVERMGHVAVSQKADMSPVTEADLAVQEALLVAIARDYPCDAVITEETQSNPDAHPPVSQARRCWIVDPIDGTRNYARSLPVFTVAVALMEAGYPVVGVVFDPIVDRMYSASAGGGLWVDDQRVDPESIVATDEVFITIPTSRHEDLPPIIHDWIDRMTVRNFGSTALHLSLLATGAFDAVYCRKAKLWDIAAGALMARQTGAETVSHSGQPLFPIDLARYANESLPFIAARPPLLEQLANEYQQAHSSS